MNVGAMALYEYYSGYPAPVVIFITRESWTSGAPYSRPAEGFVHVMPVEGGFGIMPDVPEGALTLL